ncbi:MAG TPA: hypothetical protein VKU80_04600, partial [Planctomycetota bacterium]|nr:hypothetical protein [Planctomycetota bacterium]
IGGAIFLFVVAAALVIMGISFAVDISQKVGPTFQAATVDDSGQTYTFLRVSGRGVAIFVTVLTFILAAGAAAGGIALLVLNHH